VTVNLTPSHSYKVLLAIWDLLTQVNTPRLNPRQTGWQPDRLVLDFPTPEGWKAELT